MPSNSYSWLDVVRKAAAAIAVAVYEAATKKPLKPGPDVEKLP